MKPFLLTLLLAASALTGFSQSWTPAQLRAAGTADASGLDPAEKEVFRYLNLVRLYPQDFARIELEPYEGPAGYTRNAGFGANKRSLLQELQKRAPVAALRPDAALQESARCFAEEQGRTGATGHKRTSCPRPPAPFAECNAYGLKNGRDIVLQWLVDAGVPGLGHRRNSLNGSYSRLGVQLAPHKEWRTVAVADFGG